MECAKIFCWKQYTPVCSEIWVATSAWATDANVYNPAPSWYPDVHPRHDQCHESAKGPAWRCHQPTVLANLTACLSSVRPDHRHRRSTNKVDAHDHCMKAWQRHAVARIADASRVILWHAPFGLGNAPQTASTKIQSHKSAIL